MKILVADDERNIREALVKLLEMEGFEARGAADGLEARALLEEGAWDLALLDLRMPGMGGQALLEWIESEGLILPVIMISAHGEIADAVRALKAGARDFIEKPFDSGSSSPCCARPCAKRTMSEARPPARGPVRANRSSWARAPPLKSCAGSSSGRHRARQPYS